MAERSPTQGSTAVELQSRIAAERQGDPFLVYRHPDAGQRLVALGGRRRLRDRDVARFGNSTVLFRRPAEGGSRETRPAADQAAVATISETRRRVLVALCRPFRETGAYAIPATNRAIADELFLSVDAVKAHLRALFAAFGVEHLRQTQKRMRLVERALETGAIAPREL